MKNRKQILKPNRRLPRGLASRSAPAVGSLMALVFAVVSAQLYDLLRQFDTTALRKLIDDKPDVYLRLVTSISRLSEAEAACAHRQIQQALAQLKLEQAKAIDAAIDPKKQYTGAQMLEILRHIKIL